MYESAHFILGTEENGTEWGISLKASFKGTAKVQTTLSVTENGKTLSHDMDEMEFPSYRSAQLHALDLVRAQKAAGFVCTDEPGEAPQFNDADAAADRYVPRFLIGSFEVRRGASPHNANLHDISDIYALSNFPGCELPPVHMGTLDLSAIDLFPPKVRDFGRLHVFYSNHEECDSWMLDNPGADGSMSFRPGKDGRLTVVDADAFETSCGGGEPADVRHGSEWDVFLDPPDPDRMDIRGLRVGGPPVWWQSDNWPLCPDCGEHMYFIAEFRAIQVPPGNAGGDQLLNVFLCENCRVVTNVVQFT